ncbi:glycosyltransferase family 2 protein [Lachnospiraceae bacterium ZAX-1]
MQEVTIIIPNFNGIAYIEHCLNSLRKQTVSNFNVIVVDNGSKDASKALVSNCYTEVELIALDDNYGFSRAVNEGIAHADTPYVILLNNDTEVEEAFVEELLKAIKRSPKIFSCSAKMLDFYKRNVIDDAGDLYCALGWALARGKGRKDKYYQDYTKIFAACAGAAIYRKEIFEQIGMFDERHFAYLEDIDIGYRARIYGYENRYTPTARVFHVGSGTTGARYSKAKVGLAARNNIYVIYKNMPIPQILLNLPFLLLGLLLKQLFFVKKRMGCAYFVGICKGLTLCRQEFKIKFTLCHLKNYIKIQIELWNNIWLRT